MIRNNYKTSHPKRKYQNIKKCKMNDKTYTSGGAAYIITIKVDRRASRKTSQKYFLSVANKLNFLIN